jgi:nucleoside-diphosphate-sugar epimerase
MKVFITGASGFVGYNLVLHLLQAQPDWQLFCLVRSPEKADKLAQLGLYPVIGDLLSPETYQEALKACELVFHLAGLVGLKDGEDFYAANSGTMNNLLDAAREAKAISRFVFVSSISAIDRPAKTPFNAPISPLNGTSQACPTTDYGKSKRMAELALEVSGLPYTILRPSYIHGPHPRIGSSMDRVIYDTRNQVPYTRFPFTGKASEIDVEDLARAITLSATNPNTLNKSYFISNPDPVPIPVFFSTLAKALGVPYHPSYVSPKALSRIQQRAYRHNTGPASRLMQRILFEDFFTCSPEAFMKETGFQPQYSLSEALKRTVSWYREQGLLP